MQKALLISLLFLCSCGNKRQVFKTIKQGDLKVTWYRESYISNTMAFLSAQYKGEEDTLLRCPDSDITDIYFKKDTIIVRVFQLSGDFAYDKKDKDHGYVLKLEDATYREWLMHYHPENVPMFDKKLIIDPTATKKH